MGKGDYKVFDVDLSEVRNRNEMRVIDKMPSVLALYPSFKPDAIDIQDIYALALNSVKPQYVQQVSIILKEDILDENIEDALIIAIEIVMDRPNH